VVLGDQLRRVAARLATIERQLAAASPAPPPEPVQPAAPITEPPAPVVEEPAEPAAVEPEPESAAPPPAARPPVPAAAAAADRARHDGGLRRCLCGLRTLRSAPPGRRIHSARPGRAGDAGGRTPARTCIGRPRPGRRLCHAGADRKQRTQLLGALPLSRYRHR